jgi:hypothetical protein
MLSFLRCSKLAILVGCENSEKMPWMATFLASSWIYQMEVRKMRSDFLPFRLAALCTAMALFILSCAGAVSQRRAGGQSVLSDEEFISSIKKVVDYQVSHEDAMNSIQEVRGRVVKWHGAIIKTWEDKIQISGRMILQRPRDGSPVPGYIDKNDPRNYDLFENFLFTLDHPLPRENRIGNTTPTVVVWDAVYVIGKIIDIQTIVTESGINLTLPVIQGYIISKDNDRNFKNPVWVAKKM